MKKLLAIVMIMMMLLGCAVVQADEDTQFQTKVVSIIDVSAREWFESSTNRALLTILLAIDCAEEKVEGFDLTKALQNTSYVVYNKDNKSLLVVYLCDGMSHTIAYIPGLETAICGEPIEGTEISVELALEDIGYDYHRNSMSAIMEVGKELVKILGDI